MAGGICGVIVDVINHPLDTLKTRIQASYLLKKSQHTSKDSRPGMYRGLTKGVSTNFIAFPTGFIYFAVYDSLKHYLEAISPKQSHHTMAHLLAGAFAEVSSIIIRNPFEVVKQQMQVSQESKLFQTFA